MGLTEEAGVVGDLAGEMKLERLQIYVMFFFLFLFESAKKKKKKLIGLSFLKNSFYSSMNNYFSS
jgi:hypothetical protein